jgi:hypothetical protein
MNDRFIAETRLMHMRYVREMAETVKKKMRGGRIYGLEIDEKDIDMMICAAYMLGKIESDKQYLYDLDVLTRRGG